MMNKHAKPVKTAMMGINWLGHCVGYSWTAAFTLIFN